MPRTSRLQDDPNYTKVVTAILEGQVTIKAGALALQTSEENLWHHVQGLIEAQKTEAQPVEFTEILRGLIQDLQKKVKSMMLLPLEDRPTSVIRELRGCILDLATLEGKLTAQPIVQLNQVTMQLNQITSFLYSGLCPACQAKVVEFVRKLTTNGQSASGEE